MLSRISRPFVRYLSGMSMTSASRSLLSLSASSFPGFRKKDLAENQLQSMTRQLKTSASSSSSSSSDEVETEKKLLETLTPEFCEKLTGKVTSKRFKLKNIQNELEKLYRKNFPLPESLTEEQWKILMEFNEMDLRVYYLVGSVVTSSRKVLQSSKYVVFIWLFSLFYRIPWFKALITYRSFEKRMLPGY